jgi:hypothetical protein
MKAQSAILATLLTATVALFALGVDRHPLEANGTAVVVTADPDSKPIRAIESRKDDSRTGSSADAAVRPGNSREFKAFLELNSVALKSRGQKQKLNQLLSHPILIQEAAAILAARNVRGLDPEENQDRFAAVDFLGNALMWNENPKRLAVRDAVVALVTRDLDAVKKSPALKRSMAGDQIELYQYLLRSDQDFALALFDEQQSRPQGALMAYLIQFETDLMKEGSGS